MINTKFYAYCRDNRRSADSLAKREAMHSMYNYMRECGVTKAGVKQYAEHEIRNAGGRYYDIEAYRWLLTVFEGSSPSAKPSDGQMSMF